MIWGGVNGVAAANPAGGESREHASVAPGGDANFPRPATLLRIWSTFAIICAAWVFFRAETLGDAICILQAIVQDAFSASAYQAVLDSFDQDSFLRKTAILLLLFVRFIIYLEG